MRAQGEDPRKEPGLLQDHPAFAAAGGASSPRVRRSLHRGRGWQVRYQVLGQAHFRYFADRHFGSADAALAAATTYASHNLRLHRELLALHRRLAPRATCRSGMPGVSRYDAAPGRGAHWLAYFDDPVTGRRKAKRFPVSTFGELAARLLAMEWRTRAVAAQLDRYLRLLELLDAAPPAPFAGATPSPIGAVRSPACKA